MIITTQPILSIITFLPLVGAIFIATLPKAAANNARWVALWTTIVTFFVSLLIWVNFDTSTPAFQFVEEYSWLGPIK